MNHGPDIHARLTPAMRLLVERMAKAPYPPLHTLSAAEAKAAHAKTHGVLDVPPPALPRVDNITVPARDGAALPARLYAPGTEAGLPVLLYLHGGGFTIGSIDSHDVHCRALALASGAAVLSLDYRLAPEHRFPTAVHDAWDALQWLAREGAARLGLDATRLAVGGDSAGGTLAAVSAIHARDAGLRLALQLLIYPGTTDHQDTDSHAEFAHGPVLDKQLIDWFFPPLHRQCRPQRLALRPAAPRRRGRWPPPGSAWPNATRWSTKACTTPNKLRAAGVPVALEIYRGVVHGFITMARSIPEALQLREAAGAALRAAFARRAPGRSS